MRLSRVFAIMFAILSCSAPSETASLPSRIPCGTCEGENRIVQLQGPSVEARPQHSTGYNHPVHLEQNDWTRLLRRIRVQRLQDDFLFGSRKGPIIEAFSADEIEFLAINMSKAFADSGTDETIVFGFVREHGPELSDITTGSWLTTADSLHLILANYRTAVTLPGIRQMLWNEPFYTQGGLTDILVPGEHQTLEGTTSRHTTFFSSPQANQIAIQYRFILATLIPPSSSTVTPTLPPDRLEQQLQQLRRFREQGLITEEDYTEKKQFLLDRL